MGQNRPKMTQNRSYFDPYLGPLQIRTLQIKGRKSPDLGQNGSKMGQKGTQNRSYFDLFWVILGSFWVILAEIWSFWVILAKWPYWVPGGHGWPLVDCLVSGLGPPHDPLGPQIAKMTENDPFWPFLAWDPQNDPK